MKPVLLTILFYFASFQLNAQSTPVVPADSITDKVFDKVDIEAAFPGDMNGWRRFLEKNLNANVPADNGAPVGMYTVFVQFVVDKQGNVSDIKALTSNGYGMEEEVIKVIKRSGAWTPASQNGRPVKAYRKQPVTFILTGDDFDVETQIPYKLVLNKDNRVVVNVTKVPAENIEVSVPEGVLVRNSDGSYTIHPVKKGRLVITIRNTKKQKEVGKVSFQIIDQP
mgnify:CR=1 FL=1